jgi:hypothetical protein
MARDVPWWVTSADEPQGSDSYDTDRDPVGPMEAAMENDWSRARSAATKLYTANRERGRQEEVAFAPLPAAHAEAIADINQQALRHYQQSQKRTPFGGDPRTPIGFGTGSSRPLSAGARPSDGTRPLSATKRPPLGKGQGQTRPQSAGAKRAPPESSVICAAQPALARPCHCTRVMRIERPCVLFSLT